MIYKIKIFIFLIQNFRLKFFLIFLLFFLSSCSENIDISISLIDENLNNSRNKIFSTVVEKEKNTEEINLSNIPEIHICNFATTLINNQVKWERDPGFKIYVKEANRRNLDCGV